MARVTIKHLYQYRGKWRWMPSATLRRLGATAETLGPERTSVVIARAVQLNMFWDDAREKAPADVPTRTIVGSVPWLIAEYQRSGDYAGLERSSALAIDRIARHMLASPMAQAMVSDIDQRHILALRTGLMQTRAPNTVQTMIAWAKVIFAYGVTLGVIKYNPATGVRMRKKDRRLVRRDTVWTVEQIAAVKAAAVAMGRPSVALMMQLGYDTSQRPSDLLALLWSAYDGEGMGGVQQKTGNKWWVPLSPESHVMLARTPRTSTHIVVRETTGRPYANASHFGKRLREVMRAADMPPGLQFRDLRRTAASEVLSGGGRVEPLTGHRPGSSAVGVYQVVDRDAARAAQRARIGHKSLNRLSDESKK